MCLQSFCSSEYILCSYTVKTAAEYYVGSKTRIISRPKDGTELIMDQMLPSPSFNIPSIGTPHHAMEEDQMIAPSAQEAQQTARRDTKLRRNTELSWEDGEERACREMYRKKYGK